MIVKITKNGASFKGVTAYNLGKDRGQALNFDPIEKDVLVADMINVAKCNPTCSHPVLHMILSIPKGIHLSKDQWLLAAETMLTGLGYDCNQYLVIQHNDRAHEHIHIIANRVRYDNFRVVNNSFERRRSQKLATILRKKLNLPPLPLEEFPSRLTFGEIKMLERINKEKQVLLQKNGFRHFLQAPPKLRKQLDDLDNKMLKQSVKTRIESAVAQVDPICDYVATLNRMGIQAKPRRSKSGKIMGITYGLQTRHGPDGIYWVSDRKLGRAYSWPTLCTTGLSYIPLRDDPAFNRQTPILNPVLPPEIRILNAEKIHNPKFQWHPSKTRMNRRVIFGIMAYQALSIKKSTLQPKEEDQEEQEQEQQHGYYRH